MDENAPATVPENTLTNLFGFVDESSEPAIKNYNFPKNIINNFNSNIHHENLFFTPFPRRYGKINESVKISIQHSR